MVILSQWKFTTNDVEFAVTRFIMQFNILWCICIV